MKVSYNWLKDYLTADISIDETSRILTDIGLEVDGIEKIERIRGGLEGVVVGEVLTCEDHPDSDHLHVTTVNVGAEQPLGIVCGAANIAKGQKVMVATINTTLYPIDAEEGFKIKKSKIRGVESFGMICAEDELGIGRDHAGIMVLAEDARPGTPAMEYLNGTGNYDISSDYMIEIGLTPNRIDAGSHYGVARDLAAYLKSNGKSATLRLPSVDAYKTDIMSRATSISVDNQEAAPRYVGVNISNVKVAPSPEWLQTKLRAIGLNPKNNIVDITNFVLHELAQPLHAFDADKIAGNKVVVRTYPEGTKFTTLDSVERTLSDKDLMVCDAEKPMCIAGVMGGLDSSVTEATTNVFLESAYFNPVWIRKSAKRHGINSDASFRFERGIDPNVTVYALKRAALLIKEIAGGEISSEITDILVPEILEPFRFDISFKRINALTGKELPEQKVRDILAALEVDIEGEKDGVLSVAVPPYRVDVRREADLLEDILRIYGYNNIEMPANMKSSLSYEVKPNKEAITNITANFLSANGFTEIMSNSLTKSAYYENLNSYKAENSVKILNPLSNDLGVMRQTLLFNMMEAILLNTNYRNSNLRLYEFGNVYRYSPERSEEGGLAPYSENYRLAAAMTGLETTAAWNEKATPSNFFHLKAYAEKILKRFGLDFYALKSEPTESDLYSEGLSVKINGKELFSIGIVAGNIKKQFDIKADVYYMDMNIDLLIRSIRKHKITASELPKFPEVKRDLALLVNKNVTFAALRDIAFATERKLLKEVSLFDVYEGDKLPEGKKSYALSFILQDETKTLTDQIIDKIMKNLVTQFESKAGAAIRS